MIARTIKSACVKAIAIAMAAFAASATLTAHANTTRNWIGGTGTADAPKNLWDYANWNGEGNFGTGNTVDCLLSVTDTTYLNSASGNRLCCDLLPNSGDFVFTGPLQFYSFKPGSVENSTVSVLKLCLTVSFLLTFANSHLPCYIGCFFHGMTLFSMGNFIKKTQFNKYVLLMSFCIFILSFRMPSKIDFRDNSVICGFFLIAVAYEIAGCVIVNNVFSRWMNKKIALLTYLGQNSMVFYLIHFPVMFVTVHCLLQNKNIYNSDIIFLGTSLIVTVSLIISDRIFRHDKLKFIVGG